METLASLARTHVKGGRQRITSKGKGKLKEKVTEPPSFDTFVEVPLNQILQATDIVRRERRTTTPPVLLTPPPSGI
jgi:hypothetical protein